MNITKESDHIHVRVVGSRTLETVMPLAADILSLCVEHGYDKVLIDISAMSGEFDILDSYQFSTEYLPKLGFAPTVKLAIIDLEENQNYSHLIMHNARLKGLDIMMFSSSVEAIAWLIKSPVSMQLRI